MNAVLSCTLLLSELAPIPRFYLEKLSRSPASVRVPGRRHATAFCRCCCQSMLSKWSCQHETYSQRSGRGEHQSRVLPAWSLSSRRLLSNHCLHPAVVVNLHLGCSARRSHSFMRVDGRACPAALFRALVRGRGSCRLRFLW